MPVLIDVIKGIVEAQTSTTRTLKGEAKKIADTADWGKELDFRTEFMDLIDAGESPQNAALKVENKYLRDLASGKVKSIQEKTQRKAAANVLKGKEGGRAGEGTEPSGPVSMDTFMTAVNKKASSKDLAEIMRKAGVRFGTDDV